MDSQEDPYKVLGVPKTATAQEVKKAYRKLALRWHPDKQNADSDMQEANLIFAKISNAYEILGDENKRKAHDAGQARQRTGNPRERSSSSSSSFHRAQHDDFHFHDPFEIFERVFGDGFARASMPQNNFASGFGGPAGGGGGMPQGPFGMFGGNAMNPFASHMMMHQTTMGNMHGMHGMHGMHNNHPMNHMNAMQNMSNMMMMNGMGANNSTSFTSSSFSSTNISGGNNNGNSPIVSQSTSTRIVNGHRTTEVTIQRADGTVERRVEQGSQGGRQQQQARNLERPRQQAPQIQAPPPAVAAVAAPPPLPRAAAAATVSHNGYVDNHDDIATESDVCFGDDRHPGTRDLDRAIGNTIGKLNDENASKEMIYFQVLQSMKGRRYFLVLPDELRVLEPQEIQEIILQRIHERLQHTKERPRHAEHGAFRRGSSIEELHDNVRPPAKRKK